MLTGSSAQSGMPPSARLELRSTVATAGGELRYVMTNDGEVPLLFGAGYGYEARTTEGWRPVPSRLAFPAWGAWVAPGASTAEMCARVPQDLGAGLYRLAKNLIVLQMNGAPERGPKGPISIALLCEFTVEDSFGRTRPA